MIYFYKYQGTGNDFVIIDNSDGRLKLSQEQVKKICDRRFGVGADGLMMLEMAEGFDFRMVYYNSDGGESTMCGNGGRALTKFAHDLLIIENKCKFIAIDGPHEAEVLEDGNIALQMKNVKEIAAHDDHHVLNTGSPHYVTPRKNLASLDVFTEGRSIRNSEPFAKEGINVNFIEPSASGVFVRTYERGVEDETFSCGTGVTAVALVAGPQEDGTHTVEIDTKGGHLSVKYNRNSEGYNDIWLIGPAVKVFEGRLEISTL